MPTTNAPSQKISEFSVQVHTADVKLMAAGLRFGKFEIFTDKVCFTPGTLNFVDSKQTIAMSEIVSVEHCTVMMVPTGVSITTCSGESFTYIVSESLTYMVSGKGHKREQLVDAIRRQMAVSPPEQREVFK